MKVEQRHYVDGSVQVEIQRDDGEMIASLRVARKDGPERTIEVYEAEAHLRHERAGAPPEPGSGTYRVSHGKAILIAGPSG